MGLALRLGISPKRATGWEPREIVTVHRGDDGRIASFTVEREPEWTEDQIDLLLAAQDLAGEIGPHGVPMAEATSPFADPNNPAGWHYEPRVRIDWAARAINLFLKARAEEFPEEDQASLLVRLNRVDDGPLTTD